MTDDCKKKKKTDSHVTTEKESRQFTVKHRYTNFIKNGKKRETPDQ